jgi:hypothetical protein
MGSVADASEAGIGGECLPSLLDARIYVEVDAGEASFGDTHAARC